MSTDTKWIVVGGGVFYLSGYSEFSGSPSWAFTERQALHFTTEQEATDESAKWTAQLNPTFEARRITYEIPPAPPVRVDNPAKRVKTPRIVTSRVRKWHRR